MLPRKNRLVSNQDYKKVQTLGKSYKGDFFRLSFLLFANEMSPAVGVSTKVGVIVSNKVSKKATLRNLIKRTVRDFMHEKLGTIPAGSKIAIVANPRAVGRGKGELLLDLETLFAKI